MCLAGCAPAPQSANILWRQAWSGPAPANARGRPATLGRDWRAGDVAVALIYAGNTSAHNNSKYPQPTRQVRARIKEIHTGKCRLGKIYDLR